MPDISNAETRPLPYPLATPETVVGDTPDDGTPILPFAWQTEDPDEKVVVTMELSLNEYVALASAVDIGRDIGYSTDTNWIWWIWTRSVNPVAFCAQLIACIQSDPDVWAAFMSQLAANGFAPQGNEITNPEFITMTPEQQAGDLLPAGYSCTEGQSMATARQIVREFNEAAEDFFESIELITNTAELGVIVSDGIPIADQVSTFPALVDWLVSTMTEQYQASYNQEVEDTLACAVYCIIIANCALTMDDLIGVWADFADPSVPLPDTSSFQNIADWALSLTLTVSTGTVAAFFWILAQAMRFGSGTVFQIAGLTSLKSLIAMSIGWSDTSYTECDACPPEETPNTFWYMDLQFQLGEQGCTIFGASTAFQNGGFEAITSGGGTAAQINRNLGATALTLAGVRLTSLRRGSIGNGTNDFKRLLVYPNENNGGTAVQIWNANFITCNTNDCVSAKLDFTDVAPNFKSIRVISAVDGDFVANTNFCRMTRLELWGFNHDNYKPSGSVWVASRV